MDVKTIRESTSDYSYTLIIIVVDPTLSPGESVCCLGRCGTPNVLYVSNDYYEGGNLIQPFKLATEYYAHVSECIKKSLKSFSTSLFLS